MMHMNWKQSLPSSPDTFTFHTNNSAGLTIWPAKLRELPSSADSSTFIWTTFIWTIWQHLYWTKNRKKQKAGKMKKAKGCHLHFAKSCHHQPIPNVLHYKNKTTNRKWVITYILSRVANVRITYILSNPPPMVWDRKKIKSTPTSVSLTLVHPIIKSTLPHQCTCQQVQIAPMCTSI